MPLSHPNNLPTGLEKSDRTIWCFLLLWTILNGLQAYTLEIHADEAYYWLYSRFIDWGYFDHPPMVALFIRTGDTLMHSEFGLRLMTVLSSTVSLYVLWLILKKYAVEATWFILVASGVFIFHIYGFMTTPDAPLFLFTVLFYFVYQKYAAGDHLKWALLLALIIACLLYSKYHGILLVGFTLLSNPALVKRWSFWLVVALSVALFFPHILWQADHGYPSVNYHLFEQSTYHYNFSQTYTYFPGQLMMAGPLIGVFLFYYAFRAAVTDSFIRALLVNAVGTYLFFFLSSFKGEVQPQWTLIAFAPLVMLALIRFRQSSDWQPWFRWLAIVNLAIIVLVRVLIITASPLIRKIGQVKSLYGFRQWASEIRQRAGDNYVIFNDGFQNASKYDFYNNTTRGFAYDERYYRLTQFDIWPIEEGMQNKRAYWLTKFPIKGVSTDTLHTTGGKWYGGWIPDVRTYQKVKVEAPSYKISAQPGQKLVIELHIINPYPYTINFGNTGLKHRVTFEACLFKGPDIIAVQQAGADFYGLAIGPGQSSPYKFNFTMPEAKGEYTMMFSLRTDPFLGSKNSRIFSLKTE